MLLSSGPRSCTPEALTRPVLSSEAPPTWRLPRPWYLWVSWAGYWDFSWLESVFCCDPADRELGVAPWVALPAEHRRGKWWVEVCLTHVLMWKIFTAYLLGKGIKNISKTKGEPLPKWYSEAAYQPNYSVCVCENTKVAATPHVKCSQNLEPQREEEEVEKNKQTRKQT